MSKELILTERFLARFWKKVDKTSSSHGCWLWIGCKNKWGYGRIRVRGAIVSSHRVSWNIHHGAIPESTPCVCHNCPGGDNPACVNPAHLWLGSQADNMRDRDAKGTHWVQHGERQGMHKLTESQVREIRTITGMSQRTIADIYGVSRGNVAHVRLGKTWKHI